MDIFKGHFAESMQLNFPSKKIFARLRRRPSGLRPGPVSARSLTFAYLLALGAIAVITGVGHSMTVHITNKQKESVEVAYNINRQRAIIQDIVIHAGKYYDLGARLDFDFLQQSLTEIKKSHAFLTNAITQRDMWGRWVSPALEDVYFHEPFAIDASIGKFVDVAYVFAQFPGDSRDPVRERMLHDLSNNLSNDLTRGLDFALENYQTEIIKRTAGYHRMQQYSAILVLVVLVLEGLFIFRPLVMRVENYHQILRRHALEDHLTGLNNRRAFMKRAAAELHRAARAGESVVVVMSDLDKFKSINDTYGHKTGDAVLKHYAAHLQQILRSEDLVGRIGGEEFAILLPRTGADMGFQTIDRLREVIARTPCCYVDEAGQAQSLAYTASFGLVVAAGDGQGSIDALLAAADMGLYQAKHQGRNKVVRVEAGDLAAPLPENVPFMAQTAERA